MDKSEFYSFPCGCQFKIIGPPPEGSDIPLLDIDESFFRENRINYGCKGTWGLIGQGYTLGVFQVETPLGRHWSKEIKPNSIEDFSAIGALLRPSCLKAISDGKNLTQHYADRKNGKEPVSYIHPVLENSLGRTYGVLCIHEDSFVSMSNGDEKQIKFLKPKDKIISINQDLLICDNDECFDIAISPKTEGFELILENGRSIILTGDHKVLTQRGEVEVKNLDKNSDVVQTLTNYSCKIRKNKKQIDWTILGNKSNTAYLMGYILGNGCGGYTISTGEKERHTKLLNWLNKNITSITYNEYFHTRSHYIALNGGELLNDKNFGHKTTKFRHFVRSLGLDKTGLDKKIPYQVLTSDDDAVIIPFLAGLFDSDGHSSITNNGFSVCHYSSNNYQVINGVRRLLGRYNIYTTIDTERKHISICNVERFNKIVAPYILLKPPVGKTTTGKKYGSYPKQNFKKIATATYPDLSLTKIGEKCDISKSTITSNIKKFVDQSSVEKLGVNFGDISYMRIKKITKLDKPNRFYSISVKKNHNFIANGIVVSNCYQEQALSIAREVAGFSLADADLLRIAIGKKKPEEMSKMKVKFIDGAIAKGLVSKEVAEEIFSWIEKGQRYSFNRCVSSDLVFFKQNSRGKPLTVEESYKIRTDIEYAKKTGHLDLYKKWKMHNNYSSGYSLREDGRVYANTIEDIRPVGIKPVYRVLTTSERYIDVTLNHRFPIRRKNKVMERQLRHIKVGDELIICGEYDKTIKNYKFSEFSNEDRKQRSGKSGLNTHGNKNRWYTNGSFTDFKKYKELTPDICLDCNKTNCRIETHHIDGDRTNSKPENLEKLCVSCHKKKEYKKGRRRKGQKGYPTFFEEIKSIEYIGDKECYDVTMAGPYHNFVTDQKIVTCNSHSVSYALNGFWTAYLKYHFPVQFFTSYLRFALDKADSFEEIKGLVSDARLFEISVKPPDLRQKSPHFTHRGKTISFGLLDIKGVGEKKLPLELEKLQTVEAELSKPIAKWNYLEFLLFFCTASSKSFIEPIIKSGAVDWLRIPRRQMLYEYNSISNLTDKEVDALKGLYQTHRWDHLDEALEATAKPKKDGGIAATKNRVVKLLDIINLLRNPTNKLTDDNVWKSWTESQILGLPLTASSVDMHTGVCCLDIIKDECPEYFKIAVELTNARIHTTKSGNDMMFLTVSDYSGSTENFVVFSQQLEEFQGLLFSGNTVLIDGKYEKKRGSVVVQRVKQI